MRLALYQPDIPQNTGTMLRMAACLGVAVDIIGPVGFDLSNKALRRAGLDYLDEVEMVRHVSFEAYLKAPRAGRLVVLSTRASTLLTQARFEPSDALLVGRESAGVPDHVLAAADLSVRIPMRPGLRSLNVAIAAALALGEALRQTNGFPVMPTETRLGAGGMRAD